MARTNIGATFAIATVATPSPAPDVPLAQNADLGAAAFAALTYTTVPNVITIGETGVDQNMVSQPLWDKQLSAQQKGAATGAQFPVTILDEASDGRTAMDVASAISDQNNYAFKITYSDGSVEYNRGVVSAPKYPKGGNEDFAQVTYTIASNQVPVFP